MDGLTVRFDTVIAGRASSSLTDSAKWMYPVLAAGSVLFLYLHLFRFPVTPIWQFGDQGAYLEHAVRMLHGEALYRDLFQFNLPGTEYVYYFLFRWIGVHLWIAPLAVLCAGTASTLLVYSLARRLLSGAAALLPAVAYLVVCLRTSLDGTHHPYSTMLTLLAVHIFAKPRSLINLGITGTLLAFATLFTSTRGVTMAVGMVIFLVWETSSWRRAVKPVICLLAPLIVIVAALLIHLAEVAGARTIYESLFVFPTHYYSAGMANSFSSAYFGAFQDMFPLRPVSILFAAAWLAIDLLVPAILIATWIVPYRKRGWGTGQSPEQRTFLLYAVAATFALLPVLSAPTPARLDCTSAICYILGTVLLRGLVLHRTGSQRVLSYVLAATCCAGMVEMSAMIVRHVQIVEGPRGAFAFVHPAYYEQFAWLARNARPGDRLFGNDDANFFFEMENPTRLPWVEPDAYTRPEEVNKLLEVLHAKPTRIVFWPASFWKNNGTGDNLDPLRSYLKEHYRIASEFEDATQILVRDDSPGVDIKPVS